MSSAKVSNSICGEALAEASALAHAGSGLPQSPAFPAKADAGNVEKGAPCGMGPVSWLFERSRVISFFKFVASLAGI